MQPASLQKLSGQQMGASVPLIKASPITDTLCDFLVTLVLMQVGSWIKFAW